MIYTWSFWLVVVSLTAGILNLFEKRILTKFPKLERWITGFKVVSLLVVAIFGVKNLNNEQQRKRIEALQGSFGPQNDGASDQQPSLFLGSTELSNYDAAIVIDREAVEPIKVSVENGQIQVISYIKDVKGNIIAKITGRDWKITNPTDIDFNYDATGFEIVNEENRVYFQLEITNNKVHLQGMVCSGFVNRCFFIGDGTGMRLFSTNELAQRIAIPVYSEIRPLFKYPRSEFLSIRND